MNPSTPRSPRRPDGEDFPLAAVPPTRTVGWRALTVMRLGQFTTLAQLLVGSTLGYAMGIIPAFLAFAVGTVILLLVAIPMGLVGQAYRLPTAYVTRQVGLGTLGSALFSLLSGISVLGWFGVQNALFAQGLAHLTSFGSPPLWAVVGGLGVTVMVYGGILALGWIALMTVPLFLIMLGVGLIHGFPGHSPHLQSLWSIPPHPLLSIPAATTMVVGSFIAGALVSPDMTRFLQSSRDVVKHTMGSFLLGNGLVGGTGVLWGQWMHSATSTIALTGDLGGWGAVVLFIASTIKVSDWDLYGASLAWVNGLDLFGIHRVTRKTMTIGVGLGGTMLALAGIVGVFEPFLTALGIALPPVASLVVLDAICPPAPKPPSRRYWPLLAWAGGITGGLGIPWGIAALNSLAIAGALAIVPHAWHHISRPGTRDDEG